MVLEEADCYNFGFNHCNDANFDHYIERDLVYMVLLNRNPKHAQYNCLSLMKGNKRSWEETLAFIEILPRDCW